MGSLLYTFGNASPQVLLENSLFVLTCVFSVWYSFNVYILVWWSMSTILLNTLHLRRCGLRTHLSRKCNPMQKYKTDFLKYRSECTFAFNKLSWSWHHVLLQLYMEQLRDGKLTIYYAFGMPITKLWIIALFYFQFPYCELEAGATCCENYRCSRICLRIFYWFEPMTWCGM